MNAQGGLIGGSANGQALNRSGPSNLARQQQSAAPEAAPSEVSTQIGYLAHAVDRLANLQTTLHARLVPVSVGVPERANNAASVSPAVGSGVGQALASLTERLTSLADALDAEVAALAV